MREYLSNLSQEVRQLIPLARDVAYHNNMSAYLVGGFVRDLILGVKNLDLDIVVEGSGIAFAEDFSLRLHKKIIRHRRFGTAAIVISPDFKIDIATARKESYPHPASLPLVAPGNLKDDLARRDFTINTMAISISAEDFGRLIDFFNGKEDLRQKKVRVLHDLSFIDDPTRILRAIRFEQRNNFKIEPRTLGLLKKAVSLGMLKKVSPHRLRDEVILILKEPSPIKYIRRVGNLIGFSFLSPKIRLSKRTYSFIREIERQVAWFKNKTPGKRALDTWLMYLIGLIDSMPAKDIKVLCHRFAFSKGETKRIISYRKLMVSLKERLKKRLQPSQIYRFLEPLSFEVTLLLKAKHKDKTLVKNINNFFNLYNGIRIHVDGNDLNGLEGIPRHNYKNVLVKTLYAKLNGKIHTKEEELKFIGKLKKRYQKD